MCGPSLKISSVASENICRSVTSDFSLAGWVLQITVQFHSSFKNPNFTIQDNISTAYNLRLPGDQFFSSMPSSSPSLEELHACGGSRNMKRIHSANALPFETQTCSVCSICGKGGKRYNPVWPPCIACCSYRLPVARTFACCRHDVFKNLSDDARYQCPLNYVSEFS